MRTGAIICFVLAIAMFVLGEKGLQVKEHDKPPDAIDTISSYVGISFFPLLLCAVGGALLLAANKRPMAIDAQIVDAEVVDSTPTNPLT